MVFSIGYDYTNLRMTGRSKQGGEKDRFSEFDPASYDSVQEYIRVVDSYTPLHAEQEQECIKKVLERQKLLRGKGGVLPHMRRAILEEGMVARYRLVAANLPLVVSIVRNYAKRNHDLTLREFIQEGVAGLYKAIEVFDPQRDPRFPSHVTLVCKQSIVRRIAEKTGSKSVYIRVDNRSA